MAYLSPPFRTGLVISSMSVNRNTWTTICGNSGRDQTGQMLSLP